MTLEERENLLILLKDKFERAFINLIDNDLLNLEKTKFFSIVCPTRSYYGNRDYFIELTEDWVSFRNDIVKGKYERHPHVSFIETELQLLSNYGFNGKYRYGFVAEVRFNKEFSPYYELPWCKDFNGQDTNIELYDDIFIDPIEKLKVLLKHDEDDFKDYQLKLANEKTTGDHTFTKSPLFHILIINTKDFYEIMPIQWRLVDEVNP